MHDYDGMKIFAGDGADPRRMTRWKVTALHQRCGEDNSLCPYELMLNHGADPELPNLLGQEIRRGNGGAPRQREMCSLPLCGAEFQFK